MYWFDTSKLIAYLQTHSIQLKQVTETTLLTYVESSDLIIFSPDSEKAFLQLPLEEKLFIMKQLQMELTTQKQILIKPYIENYYDLFLAFFDELENFILRIPKRYLNETKIILQKPDDTYTVIETKQGYQSVQYEVWIGAGADFMDWCHSFSELEALVSAYFLEYPGRIKNSNDEIHSEQIGALTEQLITYGKGLIQELFSSIDYNNDY